jgi:hypothetical protein
MRGSPPSYSPMLIFRTLPPIRFVLLRNALLRPRAFAVSLLLVLSVFAPSAAIAEGVASLSISPSSATYGVGKSFTVTITADSPQGFNSGNALLSFDSSLLSATAVSKNNSAFSLWAVEPAYDNSKGTVSFEGGNTTPLTGKKTILAVTFKVLKEGSAQLNFTSGAILAADGKGTDILGTKNGANFELSASAPDPTPTPVNTPVASTGPKPDAPEVTVVSHPNEELYYNAAKAKFTWDLPADVMVVRLSLDDKIDTTPTTNYDPAIAEKEFDKLTDGVMYFHLRFQNEAGWGPTTHKKIKVDTTPPPDFPLEVNPVASTTDVLLRFVATDTLSGIDRYEITIDGGSPTKVPIASVVGGSYTLKAQLPGDHEITVAAFDRAGNSTAVKGNFTVAEDSTTAKKNLEEEEQKPTDWRLIGDISLIALLAFLVGYMWYERSAFRHEKYLIKREADELRDNIGNIFAALREEVGEQAGRLFEKPNPSAEDREVMVQMNEAIDLSEELLSKEVEDVRKLLS